MSDHLPILKSCWGRQGDVPSTWSVPGERATSGSSGQQEGHDQIGVIHTGLGIGLSKELPGVLLNPALQDSGDGTC